MAFKAKPIFITTATAGQRKTTRDAVVVVVVLIIDTSYAN